MLELILGAAVVLAGALVGVELCVAVLAHPVADRLPTEGALAFRSAAGRRLGALMPPWYGVTVTLAVLTGVLLRGTPAGALSAGAAALFAATVLLSVMVLVPINNRVKTWSHGEQPAHWRRQLRRWDRWHQFRVLLCVAGLVLLTTAALTLR